MGNYIIIAGDLNTGEVQTFPVLEDYDSIDWSKFLKGIEEYFKTELGNIAWAPYSLEKYDKSQALDEFGVYFYWRVRRLHEEGK